MKIFRLAAISAAAIVLSLTAVPASAKDHWVASWGTGPAKISGETIPASGVTYRNIVRVSLGGNKVRLTLSNQFGTEPLVIGGVSVAQGKKVTFAGKESIVIAPGAIVKSDPVSVDVRPLSNLAVNIFLPAQQLTFLTGHIVSQQTNYVADGNKLDVASMSASTKPWRILTAVDVMAPKRAAAIVAFGDSITDGMGTTENANLRWPDQLAARLQANPRYAHLAVVNLGIAGNRLLRPGGDLKVRGEHHSALFRWHHDALKVAGVKYIILLEGINDIGMSKPVGNGNPDPGKPPQPPISAEDLINGMTRLINQAHAKGIKVIGATLTPFEGAKYYSPEGEKIRDAVNDFIRHGGKFDGVIDFERVTQDPANVDRFLPGFTNGKDNVHPNDAGAKAMADGIDLSIFE